MNFTSNNTNTLARIHFKARRTKSSQVKEIFLDSFTLPFSVERISYKAPKNIWYFNEIYKFLDGGRDFKVKAKTTTCMKCHKRKRKDKSQSCLKKCCEACWNRRKTENKTKKCLDLRGCPLFRMYWWTLVLSSLAYYISNIQNYNLMKI